MNKSLLCVFGILALSACVPNSAVPVVSSFNEASVGIQIDATSFDFSGAQAQQAASLEADELAAEICARGPNRRAEFASQRRIPTGQYSAVYERLYLCLR